MSYQPNVIPEKRYNNRLYRRIEIIAWLLAGVLILSPVLFNYVEYGEVYGATAIFERNYNRILVSVLVFFSPFLCNLIFNKLPIEMIRAWKETEQTSQVEEVVSALDRASEPEKEEKYELQCIKESTLLSERTYVRSGTYLFVGCIIAFAGIGIFYSPMFPVTASPNLQQRLLDYLPRFGALFFIEFIAFFFLKQYRIMLVEFRYYEAIKRKRQDNLNLLTIVEHYKDNIDLLKIITENLSFNNDTNIGGARTDIIETQKIEDLDLIAKITDIIKVVRGK